MADKKDNAEKAEKKDAPLAPENPGVSTQMYSSKIEAIKDIIFGEDYAALRLAIKDLHARIDRENAAMDEKFTGLLDEFDRSTKNRIDNLEMDLKSEIDRLDYNKADRFKLGKALEDIGRSLQEK